MSTETQVRQAPSAQEALLVIARALDRIEALVEWSQWSTTPLGPHPDEVDPLQRAVFAGPDAAVPERSDEWLALAQELAGKRTAVIESSDGVTDVVIPATSLEKQERRRKFEMQALHLSEFLGEDQDWQGAYARGGPRWLYYGNRDLVMSFPDATKQAMIVDIIEDSPEEAAEIGRDLLKAPGETGPGGQGMFMAEGDIG